MGLAEITRALRPGIRAPELIASASPSAFVGPSSYPGPALSLASPHAPRPNHLAPVVWRDVFGTEIVAPMDRASAMRVPVAARVRHIICGTVAQVPLHAYSAQEVFTAEREDRAPVPLPYERQPSWIASTGSAWSPLHRMLWTVDDLFWFGASVWVRSNDATGRLPLRMDRLQMGRWSLDDAGRVLVDRGDGLHVLVPQNLVTLIPGPHEGMLQYGQDALQHARDLQVAAKVAAKDPAAYLVLTQTEGTPLTDPEIDALLDRWEAKRRSHGGVGFLSRGIKAEELGSFSAHLLESGRNAAAVDVARAGSLPADLVDAAGESSLTYANARDNDVRGLQYGSGLYAAAIAAALSQDAVTPQGQVIRFDVQSWLGNPVPDAQPATPAQAGRPNVSRETPTTTPEARA